VYTISTIGRADEMRVWAALMVLVWLGATVGSASARPWTLRDAFAVPFINEVQLAPDGTQAIIGVGQANLKTNAFDTGYVLVDIATGSTQSLSTSLDHPRWSPDSKTIAWVSQDKNGNTAILITDTRGNPRKSLDQGGRAIVGFSWSPNGSLIAAAERSATNPSAPRFHWLDLESDYRGTSPAQRDLYIVNVASGATRRLTNDGWSYGGPVTDHDPSWSADGKRVVSVRQPSPVYGDFERAQYVALDITSEDPKSVVDHPFFAYPGSAEPLFAPESNAIAYTHSWDGKLPSREDVFVDGRDVSAALDRDLWSCGAGTMSWSRGGFIMNLLDGVSMRLYRLDPSGAQAPQPLTDASGSVEGYSVADTGRIAYIWSTPEAPPELYVRDTDGSSRQVTHLVKLPADLPVATTRFFTWSDGNGHTLGGQLTLPSNGAPTKTAPLILEPHGGPQCSDDSSFSGEAQYFASNGYVFFRPDPPGSDGYGDWSYKAIVGNWGAIPMAADIAGLDAIEATGIGDPSRTFIEGGSYGGYLTSWIVTHTTRFRAAVAQVPVTDLLQEYTLSESPNITRRFFGDRPATSQSLLAEQSPLTYASQEKTPLLIIVGLADTRAPYTQAIEFYKTLAEFGAPVRMLADSKAGHGPFDPQGIMAWLSATAAWIAQHGGIAIPDASLPQ
ncbi:MAG TPA: S9 family peptidase, partial [Candidatus Aquilonibacter sp.]